jgi:hypothetical protein
VDKPYNQPKFYKHLEDAYSVRVNSVNEAIDFILNEVDDE